LEDEGIPVNFNSIFSGRQVVADPLLVKVMRTNIFMGRLNQGLKADLLGAHVSLEAQRILLRLRQDPGIYTQLIVASLRDWRSFSIPLDAMRIPYRARLFKSSSNRMK
jgi:hypothetical protein